MNVKTCCNSRKALKSGLKSRHIIKKGTFPRKDDSKRVPRYHCKICGQNFSSATFSWTYHQKKRKINQEIRRLLIANVCMNRIAVLVGVDYKTVARRLEALSRECQRRNEKTLMRATKGKKFTDIQLDELETFEQSKLTPLSVPVVVSKERLILGFDVCSMPPHEVYEARSLAKFGPIPDDRTPALKGLLERIKSAVYDFVSIRADECHRYPWAVYQAFPGARLQTFYARKAKPQGFGELKTGSRDPLWAINHTLAKLRANISRLNRRTWATTKKRTRLIQHLWIFVESQNRYILNQLKLKGKQLSLAG